VIDGEEYGIAVGGMYNVYNALAATAVAEYYQVAPDKIRAGLAYDEKVFFTKTNVHSLSPTLMVS
jgi:UDP-N-acetylmuramyl tripeptide synthase